MSIGYGMALLSLLSFVIYLPVKLLRCDMRYDFDQVIYDLGCKASGPFLLPSSSVQSAHRHMR
jgi:hypothetical protein